MPSRVIRGEINASESLSQASPEAELVFRALLLAVDDFGRADARPAALKAALFPMRDAFTPKKIAGWIKELSGLTDPPLRLYEADGRLYLWLPKWEKHRGGGRRASESRFPSPPERFQEILGNPRDAQEILSGSEGRVAGDEGRVATARDERSEPDAEEPEPISLEAVRALPDEFIAELAEARLDFPSRLRAPVAIRAWLEQKAPAMRERGYRSLRRTARAWWRRANAAEVIEALDRAAKIELRSRPSDAEARASPPPEAVTAAVLSMTHRLERKPA